MTTTVGYIICLLEYNASHVYKLLNLLFNNHERYENLKY